MGITAILAMIQGAISVIGAFKGSASSAKLNGQVQEAIGVIGALTPLVQNFGSGQEVTEDEMRAALTGRNAALAALDKAIADAQAAAGP